MSNSSGKSVKDPHESLQSVVEVRALPDGLTPKGCLRTMDASSTVDSSISAGILELGLSLFEGRPESSCTPGWSRVMIPQYTRGLAEGSRDILFGFVL